MINERSYSQQERESQIKEYNRNVEIAQNAIEELSRYCELNTNIEDHVNLLGNKYPFNVSLDEVTFLMDNMRIENRQAAQDHIITKVELKNWFTSTSISLISNGDSLFVRGGHTYIEKFDNMSNALIEFERRIGALIIKGYDRK